MSRFVESLGKLVRWSFEVIAGLGALALVLIIIVGIIWLAAAIPGEFMEFVR